MKIGLFSGIHGNLPAFEDMAKYQTDDLYCIGDLVNFMPWSNQIVDLLRSGNIPIIKENHDQGIGRHQEIFRFSFYNEEKKQTGLKAIACTKGCSEIRESLRLEYENYLGSHTSLVSD